MRRRHVTRILSWLWPAIVAAALHAGCTNAVRSSPPADGQASAPVPNLYDAQQQIAQYIDSGRYDADVARVAQQAQTYVEQRAGAVAKPAIVLDIDETSLSNWPAYRVNGWVRIVNGECDLQQGPCGVRAFQARGQSTAIQPTLHLAQRAEALGVAVFFITGRPAALREVTERNLREQGFQWTDVTFVPDGARFASVAEFKSAERKRIAEQGYTILLTMGDQESDLRGGYAERTFKLPNPVYVVP